MGTSTGRADLTAFPIFSPGNVCWFTGDRDHGDPITGCLNWLQVMLNVMFAGKDPERVRVRQRVQLRLWDQFHEEEMDR